MEEGPRGPSQIPDASRISDTRHSPRPRPHKRRRLVRRGLLEYTGAVAQHDTLALRAERVCRARTEPTADRVAAEHKRTAAHDLARKVDDLRFP